VARIGQLAAEAIHLCPRKKGQPRMLGRMFEQNMNPVLLDGIHQQEGVVRANQDLELA
jgi:hypothetical protein